MKMIKWVTLNPAWELQDVQAGLNVILAALFAGAIFSFVRWHWLLAARRVLKRQQVPAYLLLSLNTVGETIDVMLLLRDDLFSLRFAGLLLQTICVILLSIAAILAGFMARYSTRNDLIVQPRRVIGLLSERAFGSAPYSSGPTNATMNSLRQAGYPPTQLPEYVPPDGTDWVFVPSEWNSSWTMECTFEENVPIPNPATTGNCTDMQHEIPFMNEPWSDWDAGSWYYDFTGWRNNYTRYRDILIFSHGIELGNGDDSEVPTEARIRTVATHLYGVPYNTSLNSTSCNFDTGDITSAHYTSFTCNLKRNLGNRSEEDVYWGAYPDGYDLSTQVNAHVEHYGYNFRLASSALEDYELMSPQELVLFYQAYLLTKDTAYSRKTGRQISVRVQVAQISLKTLIICPIAAVLILCSVAYYWAFLWHNRSRLDQIPQSKLDWMLQSLKKQSHGYGDMRKQLHTIDLTESQLSGTTPLVGLASPNIVDLSKHASQSSHEELEPSRYESSPGHPTPDFSMEYPVLRSVQSAHQYRRLDN